MMIAPGDQRRPCGRAQRGGVELGVAKSRLGDPVQCWCRDNTAERATDAIPLVVGHDQQHVGRTLRRHDTRRPPGFRILGALLDYTTEIWRWWRELFPSIAVVALGEPSSPDTCWALAGVKPRTVRLNARSDMLILISFPPTTNSIRVSNFALSFMTGGASAARRLNSRADRGNSRTC